MLKNVKSVFFIRIIFSHLEDKKKLKIIKYNKIIQKNINISIINYKHFQGKYIVYESDEFGKEYNGINDHLIFEGEYYEGERNGFGREFNEYGNIIFEGEYLNGKRKNINESENIIIKRINISGNGEGKEYDNKGKLLFIGEYIDGDRNGKGREYYYNGCLKYEGEYLNDKRNGKGKEYYDDNKLLFEGEYINNKKWEGKGYDLSNNLVYVLKDGKGYVKQYHYDNKLEFLMVFLKYKMR